MASSASISQRVFAFVPDKTMLFTGEYLRQFKITNQWQRIRIGIECAFTPDSTNSIADCGFFLGICSGNQGLGSWFTPYFIGASLIGTSTPASTRTMTYTANTNNPYFAFTAGNSFKKVETTITSIAALTATAGPLSYTGWFKRRACYYVDITKTLGGSGACTITVYGPTAANTGATDMRPDDFMEGLDTFGAPIVNGITLTQLASTATTVSEALGPLDTFNLLWTRTSFPLEVSALGASVVYANETYTGVGGADETFDQYYVYSGTAISNGSTPVPSGVLSGGTGWSGPIILGGSYSNPSVQIGLAGTSAGMPDETFESYDTGSLYSGGSNGGIGWGGAIIIGGSYSNPAPQYGLAGTSSGFPDDTFESYGTGTITSGVTINAGTGWQGAAYIYP